MAGKPGRRAAAIADKEADHIIERAFALAPDNDQIKSHRSRIKQQL